MARRSPERRAGAVVRLAEAVLRPVAAILAEHRWTGTQNLPVRGAAICCGNHTGPWDAIAYGLLLQRSGIAPRFLAKESLFRAPVLGFVLRAAEQIPVSRTNLRSSGGLDAAEGVLSSGRVIMMFPEATYTRDPQGWPMRARHGAARLALRTGAPLVPIACWGSRDLWPPRTRWPRPVPRRRIRLRVGEPFHLELRSGETEAQSARRGTEELMSRITALLAELREETPPQRIHDPRGDAQRPEDL